MNDTIKSLALNLALADQDKVQVLSLSVLDTHTLLSLLIYLYRSLTHTLSSIALTLSFSFSLTHTLFPMSLFLSPSCPWPSALPEQDIFQETSHSLSLSFMSKDMKDTIASFSVSIYSVSLYLLSCSLLIHIAAIYLTHIHALFSISFYLFVYHPLPVRPSVL